MDHFSFVVESYIADCAHCTKLDDARWNVWYKWNGLCFGLQRLELRQRAEAELRQRIEQLEKRQMQDDAVLNVINRYWNQLNEDVRILLQRFDAETADENENRSNYTYPFNLDQVANLWHCKDLLIYEENRIIRES